MPKTTFVYCDMGNVLLYFDNPRACRQMAEVAQVPADVISQFLRGQDIQRQLESGQISTAEAYEAFCKFTERRPARDALVHAGSDIFHANASMVPLIGRLAATGIGTGLLSNTCAAHWEFVSTGRYRFLVDLFDIHVLSFRVRLMKPDPQIFAAATKAAGVPADEIFYTDDMPEHVAAARSFGWRAVVFESPSQLARDLRSAGVEFYY